MGQALYRKYRSKSLDEVVGQEHVTNTLKKAIQADRISHAYLFTGPRGVGKTSVARILAHEVNSLPYSGEDIHLDIIEIDAASNRRIDEIRDLRDKVHISPTSAKYKVYIIDEVHMLTREAFNALLKTLEEPPAHCIFILATTEAQKLPETIVSRTQRYNFKAIGPAKAVGHLSAIAKEEKISITPEALDLLAAYGDGSFRDSINLLDQLGNLGKKIDEPLVRQYLGLPPLAVIDNLVDAARAGRSQDVLAALDGLKESGAEAPIVAKMVSAKLRQLLLANQSGTWCAALLRQLIEVPSSPAPADSLEIALLESAASLQTEQTHRPEKAAAPATTAVPKSEPTAPKKTPEVVPTTGSFDLTMWEAALSNIKNEAAALYTALRLAEPKLEDGKLILAFEFPLHQKKVDQARHKDIIGRHIEQLSGDRLFIECIVDKNASPRDLPEPSLYKAMPDEAAPLQTINNIFGSAEVLES